MPFLGELLAGHAENLLFLALMLSTGLASAAMGIAVVWGFRDWPQD